MHFYLLTDCNNLFINKPNKYGKFCVNSNFDTESKEEIKQQLLLRYVESKDENALISDLSPKQQKDLENEIDKILDNLPMNQLVATQCYGNVDCCQYFLYKSDIKEQIWISTDELDMLFTI